MKELRRVGVKLKKLGRINELVRMKNRRYERVRELVIMRELVRTKESEKERKGEKVRF